ncbi:hypothetical protein KR038_001570, partial [Drosophila bunnanda]
AGTEYGRGCGDIGCLPTEECIITSDSCSYNQRDGKDCGSYPTCKRRSGGGGSVNSSPNQAAAPSANPSGSSLGQGPENNIFAPASSNPTLNTYTYSQGGGGGGGGDAQMAAGNGNAGNGERDKSGSANSNGNGNGNGNAGAAGASSTGIIDPHYVFGAKHHMPIIPNMPIFPYNSPTSAPSFQQFPQPNHPGSVLNPGYPMHGLQPVNPYNPPFVFGQLPFYGGGGPTGTGGPPGGVGGGAGIGGGGGGGMGLPSSTLGILGGGGGGLAPYGSNYQGYQSQHSNANMYNKPPPQYQNQNQQNPYNRRTQAHPSAGGVIGGTPLLLATASILLLALLHT